MVGYFAVGVDPEEGVFDFLLGGFGGGGGGGFGFGGGWEGRGGEAAGGIGGDVGGLVDADVDGDVVLAGLVAEGEDEGGGLGGLGEADGCVGVGGDVVACFGEEEGLLGGCVRWKSIL